MIVVPAEEISEFHQQLIHPVPGDIGGHGLLVCHHGVGEPLHPRLPIQHHQAADGGKIHGMLFQHGQNAQHFVRVGHHQHGVSVPLGAVFAHDGLPETSANVAQDDVHNARQEDHDPGVFVALLCAEHIQASCQKEEEAIADTGFGLLPVAARRDVVHGVAQQNGQKLHQDQKQKQSRIVLVLIGIRPAKPEKIGNAVTQLKTDKIDQKEIKMLYPAGGSATIHFSSRPTFPKTVFCHYSA